ncbi:MAG: SoxR reducing system RseC family protein [Clostridiales bacterium]|nr:SoxR reducing system RseC family protein [Clostridiales bacterium]
MTQVATVEKILNDGFVEISVPRKSACGHDCEECAGCGMTGAAITATAKDPVGVSVGEKVVVESSTRKLLGVVALVYVLPVVLFLLGYFLSYGLGNEGWRYTIAIVAAAVAFIPCIFYDRYAKKHGTLTYTISRIF